MKRSPLKRTAKKARRPKMADADALFSRFIRERDGKCMAQGFPSMAHIACSGWLECCHIVKRDYHRTRWDPANSISQCQAHHFYQTHHPIEERRFFLELLGHDELKRLEVKATDYSTPAASIKDVCATLRQMIHDQELESDGAA